MQRRITPIFITLGVILILGVYTSIHNQRESKRKADTIELTIKNFFEVLFNQSSSERRLEYLGIEYLDIQGDIATVVIRVKISESGEEPLETTVLHKYRWENGEWKFIDWFIEPEMYKGGVNECEDNCPNQVGPLSNDGCPEEQENGENGGFCLGTLLIALFTLKRILSMVRS